GVSNVLLTALYIFWLLPGSLQFVVRGFCLVVSGLNLSHLERGNVAADLLFKRGCHVAVLAQEFLGVFASLAQADIANIEPRAALLHQAHFQTEVDQTAFARNTLAIHDVKLCYAEGRSDLILYHAYTCAVAHYILA